MTDEELEAKVRQFPDDPSNRGALFADVVEELRALKKARDFSDAPMYEIEGAIRSAVVDVITALGVRRERESREQTAATILAALIRGYDGQYPSQSATGEWLAREAVRMAEALRAELAKAAP